MALEISPTFHFSAEIMRDTPGVGTWAAHNCSRNRYYLEGRESRRVEGSLNYGQHVSEHGENLGNNADRLSRIFALLDQARQVWVFCQNSVHLILWFREGL